MNSSSRSFKILGLNLWQFYKMNSQGKSVLMGASRGEGLQLVLQTRWPSRKFCPDVKIVLTSSSWDEQEYDHWSWSKGHRFFNSNPSKLPWLRLFLCFLDDSLVGQLTKPITSTRLEASRSWRWNNHKNYAAEMKLWQIIVSFQDILVSPLGWRQICGSRKKGQIEIATVVTLCEGAHQCCEQTTVLSSFLHRKKLNKFTHIVKKNANCTNIQQKNCHGGDSRTLS